MQTLFEGRYPEPANPRTEPAALPAVTGEGPNLLVTIAPWHRVFFGNLFDLLLFRREPPLQLTCEPAAFWPDVFVSRPLPLGALRQSAVYHLFLVAVLWGFSHALMLRRPALPVHSPFAHQTITYYSISEYLPLINDAAEPAPAREAKKGEPAFAKQHIRSIRSDAESRTQTIIAPPRLRLPHDVPIPNIVAYTPVPAAVPQAAAVHNPQELIAPAMEPVAPPAPTVARATAQLRLDEQVGVVEPSPDIGNAKLRTPTDIIAKAVEPAPRLGNMRVNNPNLPTPSAVEPPPNARNVPTKMGDINMAAKLTVVAPALSITEQRARGSLLAGTARNAERKGVNGDVGAVPPPPSVQSLAGAQAGGPQGAGQLIALGIHPLPAAGPISVPQGNRSGTFEAGPAGKPGAPGTPEIKGGGIKNGPGGNGSKQGPGGNGTGAGTATATGITVSRGPTTPADNVVVAGTPKPQPAPRGAPTLLASLGHASVADLARNIRPGATPPPSEPKIEAEVFGGKRYYQMTLNMPNLTSHSGSWIVRFAELNATPDKGELTAPVAIQKVDPAYSADLIREQVEGTVVLFAIIRSDGSVADVRVLHGVDDRLDANAREAFMKWHFRPGTKNGKVVDLEAVIRIPFVASPLPY
jgi:TonB family protein